MISLGPGEPLDSPVDTLSGYAFCIWPQALPCSRQPRGSRGRRPLLQHYPPESGHDTEQSACPFGAATNGHGDVERSAILSDSRDDGSNRRV